MAEHPLEIGEDRPLTPSESTLVRWLLENGGQAARAYLPAFNSLRVVSRCGCGCASIGFAKMPGAGLETFSNFHWEDPLGRLFGVFLFAKAGSLAGLEVYSKDGRVPAPLPSVASLQPYG